MYAIHQNILPSSVVTHSLFLPNFTPSTIYPLPQLHDALDAAQIKVVGNLIVAGGQDLRVFEIREEIAPVTEDNDLVADDVTGGPYSNGISAGRGPGDEEGEIGEDVGDSFFDNGPSEVCINSSAAANRS
jgi:cleavage and polyadenylation specificity factor subunit 1